MRYVLALVVGLVAIPGLAFATNSALTADDVKGVADTAGATGSTVATAAAGDISAEDLVRACGVEGHYLVELEAVNATDEIQQAALNALRPICQEAGLPLPPAPLVEGETIVETVTVVRTAPGAGPVGHSSATTVVDSTPTTRATTSTTGQPHGQAAEALAARDRALTAIQTAIDVGGKVEKINEAIEKVDKGDASYEAGDYINAMEHYEEAEHKAIEAQREPEEHDEYEEDEHDDDEHDDDEHEEDEHEESH
ncbi:MAG: hypothetical protein ACR2OI_12160 [Acidimicrobiia bacterium]